MARSVPQDCLMTAILLVYATFPFALGKSFMFEKTFLQGFTIIPFLRTWTNRNEVQCAMACTGLSECKSFSILPSLHKCNLYSSRITVEEVRAAPSSEQETFYWKQTGVCPLEKGYAIVPGTHKCLRMSEAAMIWTEAEATCEAEGGHLAIIEDLATWGAVRAFLESVGPIPSTNIYVGGLLTTTGQWLWVDGRAVEENLWIPGQPDFSNSLDPCFTLRWGSREAYFVVQQARQQLYASVVLGRKHPGAKLEALFSAAQTSRMDKNKKWSEPINIDVSTVAFGELRIQKPINEEQSL